MGNNKLKQELKELKQVDKDKKEVIKLKKEIADLKESQRKKSPVEKFLKNVWKKI